MPERILSISGLRGIIGDGLDPAYVLEFAQAVGTMAGGGTVVVGRDGRNSGQMLKHAVVAGLQSVGCNVIDVGVCATPTCGYLVRSLNAEAGLEITASHNPPEWNGLKPFSGEGAVLDEAAGRTLLEILQSKKPRLVGWDRLGTADECPAEQHAHLDRILERVDVALVRSRKLRVVLDCNHGSGGVLGPSLLSSLGCGTTVLGGTPDGAFAHPPEPLRENLAHLCQCVAREKADVGFAQDPDADRLAIVDNRGRYIGEELTIALCADFVLSHRPGPFVVNGSTSRVSADVAARHNCPFHRSAVGEANVVAKMKEVNAVLGGEGNGGVIEPEVGWVRDSFVGMAYILAGLCQRGGDLAAWVDSLPRYSIVKAKLDLPKEKVADACTALAKHFPEAAVTFGDGLRLDWPDRWVQLRGSNTEPIARVIAEAPDEASAQRLCADAMEFTRRWSSAAT